MENRSGGIIDFTQNQAGRDKKQRIFSLADALQKRRVIVLPEDESDDATPEVEPPLIVRFADYAERMIAATNTLDRFPLPDAMDCNGIVQAADGTVLAELDHLFATAQGYPDTQRWASDAQFVVRQLDGTVDDYTSAVSSFAEQTSIGRQVRSIQTARLRGIALRRTLRGSYDMLRRPMVFPERPQQMPDRNSLEIVKEHAGKLSQDFTNAFYTLYAAYLDTAKLKETVNQTPLAEEIYDIFHAYYAPEGKMDWFNTAWYASQQLIEKMVAFYATLAPLAILDPKKSTFWNYTGPSRELIEEVQDQLRTITILAEQT